MPNSYYPAGVTGNESHFDIPRDSYSWEAEFDCENCETDSAPHTVTPEFWDSSKTYVERRVCDLCGYETQDETSYEDYWFSRRGEDEWMERDLG